MERVKGYFTVERNILGLTLQEMEPLLGLRPGRLTTRGARVLVLSRQPSVGQFMFAGSTRYSNAKGLVGAEQRQNFPIPHAWFGQRLVKVVSNIPHSPEERYPAATTFAVEQWELVVPVTAEEVCRLNAQQKYWGRR